MKVKGFVHYKFSEHKENEFMPCVLVIKNGEIVEYESGFFKNIFPKENNSALSKIDKISKTHNPKKAQNKCKYYIQHSIDGEVMNIYLDINIFQYWILKRQLKQYLIQTNGFKQAFYIALFVFALTLFGYYIKRTKIDTIQIPTINQTTKPKRESENGIRTENRILYILDLDTLKRTEKYKLTIEPNDSIIKYEYLNINDNEKNVTVRYNLNSKILSLDFWEFELAEKNKYSETELSNKKFDLFLLKESVTDGNGPMLFNENYGLLNIDNGWGMKFIYLKAENKPELIKDIIANLNK